MVRRVAAVVEQSWHRVPGGTAISTVRTLDAIQRLGVIDVVGLAAGHVRQPPPHLRPTVEVKYVPLPRLWLYEVWHRFRRPSPQRFTGPVDVVHATGGAVPPPGSASLVVTVHDLAFLHRPGHFTKHGVRFLTRGFELTRRGADLVICPSDATARDCLARGVEPDRVRVIPWGVTPVEVDATDLDRVRRLYRLPAEFVLWVGTAEPRKNLRGLLAAMDRTDVDIPLVLVGPDGWGTDLSELLDTTRHPVRHLGSVPQGDLAALYTAARVFVYPSLMEGFGMPVLEAMAQGTPVVTSSGTATEEVCGDAGHLVDPNDLDGLAGLISMLTTDDREHAQRAEAGRARAARFTWRATAEATVAAYEEAAR
jgi:glycosyltransferase involved in cell wall biosynthesis